MKKILFFILLSMSLTCFAQDPLSIDSKQTNGTDSIRASHTTFSSNTLEDATKAEGDSAYIKEDYAAVLSAVKSGKISNKILHNAVRRVLAFKYQYQIA